jgi:6-phosphogluconate dehydrogenase (decarboxylating)
MGTNMVWRLLRAGHQCVVSDLYPEPVQALVKGEWDRGNALRTMP